MRVRWETNSSGRGEGPVAHDHRRSRGYSRAGPALADEAGSVSFDLSGTKAGDDLSRGPNRRRPAHTGERVAKRDLVRRSGAAGFSNRDDARLDGSGNQQPEGGDDSAGRVCRTRATARVARDLWRALLCGDVAHPGNGNPARARRGPG